jgi:hypothetical protein
LTEWDESSQPEAANFFAKAAFKPQLNGIRLTTASFDPLAARMLPSELPERSAWNRPQLLPILSFAKHR